MHGSINIKFLRLGLGFARIILLKNSTIPQFYTEKKNQCSAVIWHKNTNKWWKGITFFSRGGAARRLIVEVSRSHTIRHTYTTSMTPLHEWSARSKGCAIHNTQHTQQTNIHALSRFRTHNPSYRAASDVRLRPHGHRDRLTFMKYAHLWKNSLVVCTSHCYWNWLSAHR